MWTRIHLRIWIYMILAALVFITLAGGVVTVWDTYRMERLLSAVIDEDVAAFQAAESMEAALINQKGFVSYYFLDRDPDWLRQLGDYRRIFKERLEKTRALVENDRQRKAIEQIESEYLSYISAKDRVIAHYKAGEQKEGVTLHRKVRDHFFKLFDLCEEYKDIHRERIRLARKDGHAQARNLRFIAGIAIFADLSLGVLLVFVLVRHILGPVRRLIREADTEKEVPQQSEDEIKALSRSVRGLIENAGQTHIELERSRETLLQSEKMAIVGQLAAGTAHSIRNPLTSVKMRLFSLNRSLELSDTQKEDFEVISEEIRHIDTIVQNFLEFSRPPKLKIEPLSPSVAVDMAIQLLEHRLKSYHVDVRIIREQMLPDVQADPEQLKEVIVNLVVNACESMEKGGEIVIREEEFFSETLKQVAVIRVSDNGPGIPESLREKIFEPFFTTKDEGTGLGLSIAFRIIEEHQGWLDVTSEKGRGATFVIMLPIRDHK
ncbi:ATP-binding protein [Desulfobacterales bacterium HSG2]|nr:ATP-binding protein [Desulfobacterales bacterium HSG2]